MLNVLLDEGADIVVDHTLYSLCVNAIRLPKFLIDFVAEQLVKCRDNRKVFSQRRRLLLELSFKSITTELILHKLEDSGPLVE